MRTTLARSCAAVEQSTYPWSAMRDHGVIDRGCHVERYTCPRLFSVNRIAGTVRPMRIASFVAAVAACSAPAPPPPSPPVSPAPPPTAEVAPPAPTSKYPAAQRGSVVEQHHGVAVPDPYRWLEEMQSPAARAFVEAQNKLSDE